MQETAIGVYIEANDGVTFAILELEVYKRITDDLCREDHTLTIPKTSNASSIKSPIYPCSFMFAG